MGWLARKQLVSRPCNFINQYNSYLANVKKNLKWTVRLTEPYCPNYIANSSHDTLILEGSNVAHEQLT